MKRSLVLVFGSAALVTAGCAEKVVTLEDKAELNRAMLEWHATDAINGAVARQRAVYPYHFVEGSAELNDLGRRDLDILAGQFRGGPGRLSMRRGDGPPALHDARVDAALRHLAQAGVSMGDVIIDEALPGGDGTSADRVLKVQDRVPSDDDGGDLGGVTFDLGSSQ